MTDPSRRFPWFRALLLVLVFGGLVGLGFLLAHTGVEQSGNKSAGTNAPSAALAFLGFVDLEHGVPSLTPLNPSRIVAVLVKENDPVEKGQVLMQLEDEPARHRVAEAQAALASARTQLIQAEKGVRKHEEHLKQQQAAVEAMGERVAAARAQLLRKRELLKFEQASARDVEAAEHQVKELEALEKTEKSKLVELELVDPGVEVNNAREQVKVMEARLEQARDALSGCQLKTPEAGRVLRILAGPGDVVGGPGRQPVIQFACDNPRLVRVEIEQEQARRVKPGMPARIVDDTDATQEWTGKVERVSDWYTRRRAILREGPSLHDERTVECLISLDKGQLPPRLGLRVQVAIGPGAAN